MVPLLVALFVLSGLAGLIYESIWTRYLGLFLGHDAYAQILVLIIFMGGMALGAFAAGRRSDRLPEPLLAYASIEAVLGIMGLLFHPLYVAVTGAALDTWFPAVAGTPWLPLVKWGIAGFLILPQSVLLGATFPLMAAGVIRRAGAAPGRQLGLLYSANSLGAAAGVLVSGFVLVGAVGLPGTVAAAGLLNLVVAGVVSLALRAETPAPTTRAAMAPSERTLVARAATVPPARAVATTTARTSATPLAHEGHLMRLLLIVSFATAVASFIYEIAWNRMLALVLGSATHAFEVMLSAFILGLALGAWWIRSRADRLARPLRTLGIIQWAMGSLALATIPVYMGAFHWTADLVRALPGTENGYGLYTLARYGICLAIMLPATFCAGATLPLLTRTLLASGPGERAIGLVYGVNTLGSILGVGLAGLILMPVLGLKGLLMSGALLDIALGIALLAFDGREAVASRRLVRLAVGLAALTAIAAGFARFDRYSLMSGVYRQGHFLDPRTAEILHYGDGRTATVGVWRSRENGTILLSTNGKTDASLGATWMRPPGERPPTVLHTDESTQTLVSLIALAHAPAAETVAVIGQGSGMTSHLLLGSPYVRLLETIEIEPEVVRASRCFLPANHRVFDNPRARFVIDDAKSHFAASGRRYDLILSEPSNPWVSGVAGLFSTEFYRRIRRYLSPEGVFGQWIHLYEINDDLVLSVIAALHENFGAYEIFMVDVSDVLIIATSRPSGLVPDWSVVRDPGIVEDLRHIPPFTPGTFEAMRATNRRVLAPLLAGGVVANSDFHPRLDLGAERARFMMQVADGLIRLHGDRFAFSPMVLRRALGPPPTPYMPAPEIPRLRFLSIGAALRMERLPDIEPSRLDPRLAVAMERMRRLAPLLAAGAPPSDWRAWTLEALHAEEDLDMGTSGFADPAYFTAMRRYMDEAGAPAIAREAVEFVHSVAIWDFADAARRSDALVARAAEGEEWVPLELLLDGAVAAKLLTGDRTGARRVHEALVVRSGRDPRDLRSRLVAAYFRGAQPAP